MQLLQRRTAGEAIFDFMNNVFMLIVCFVTLYPVWYVLVNSFNEGADAMRGGIYWCRGSSVWAAIRRYLPTTVL